MFRSLYSGTDGWKGSFLKVLDDILFSFVDMGIQMAANWVAQQFAMTTAAVAGSTARTTAVATEAATTTSISAGTALLQILNYAWTAASGAYSAIAGIPIIGPFLAPVLAAGALAAVAGFAGNILSAKGGLGAVPKDGMLAELHKDEMVLPAQFATPLRNMLTSVEGPRAPQGISTMASSSFSNLREENNMRGGDTNLYYQPVNSGGQKDTSLDTMLRRDGRKLKKWMMNEFRNDIKKGAV